MKISVAWINGPTAKALMGELSAMVKTPLLAECRTNGFAHHKQKFQVLSYEAVNYREGNVVAGQIVTHLDLNYPNHTLGREIWINGKPEGYYVCQLEKKVGDAIEALKATRGWLRDHRIAEIRRELEKDI